jgi:hypothetical protein
MYKDLKKPYTLAGIEPGFFCSGGGHDDHQATLPEARFLSKVSA